VSDLARCAAPAVLSKDELRPLTTGASSIPVQRANVGHMGSLEVIDAFAITRLRRKA
jgi:hypothetical protein